MVDGAAGSHIPPYLMGQPKSADPGYYSLFDGSADVGSGFCPEGVQGVYQDAYRSRNIFQKGSSTNGTVPKPQMD